MIGKNLSTRAEDETFEDIFLTTLLDGHFAPKSNRNYEQYLFRHSKQNSDEKIQQFSKRVQQQAMKCNFGDTNTEIKQQFIIATSSNKQTLLFL